MLDAASIQGFISDASDLRVVLNKDLFT